MPEFAYKARDTSGSSIGGTLQAPSQIDCLEMLQRKGLSPTRVTEVDETKAKKSAGEARDVSLKTADLVMFTRQLGAVYNAGIPLVEGLKLVENNLENPELRAIIGAIWRDVEGGESLADAMRQFPRAFRPFFVSAIQAGQASGGLQQVLQQLQELLEEQHALRKEIMKSLRYPATVVIAIGIAMVVIFAFVVPSLSGLFDRLGDNLPGPTRGLLFVQGLFQQNVLELVVVLVLGSIGGTYWWRSGSGQAAWDAVRFKVPGFGKLFWYHAMSRFASTLAMLNSGGGALIRNLEITAEAMNSKALEAEVMGVRNDILEGSSLSESMAQREMFPEMMVHLLRVGETSGRLDDFLEFLGDHYDEECRYQSRNIVHWVEPILTVGLGGAILYLAFAIFLPYWNMIQAFKGGSPS